MSAARRRELDRAITPCRGRGGPIRVAMISMHTSPLAQPGVGDAGGMNVYVRKTAAELAALGVGVEVFTRATASTQPPVTTLSDGVTVHHVPAGPFEGIAKNELSSQLCAFTSGLLRTEAARPSGYFDVVHSHYWLSGQSGWLAADRWGVPLVHTAHTLAKVKNLHLAATDTPEPLSRVVGEEQVVTESDALVTNTAAEASELVDLYDADPGKVVVTPPGVDTDVFAPGDRAAARRALGIAGDELVIGFAGRIQPLKAPDVLLRAVADLRRTHPGVARRVRVVIVGGPSGNGTEHPHWLPELARDLGIAPSVMFLPPRADAALAAVFRACDVVCVPSHNETFGLVALEAQACGTPVVAAAVGGLTTAVADGHSGVLVDGHDPRAWAHALGELLGDPRRRAVLSAGAREHAAAFTWAQTARNLLRVYRDAITANRSVSRRAVVPGRALRSTAWRSCWRGWTSNGSGRARVPGS
ncbi:D-inositol-3-phosphate glycosyltransferase [Stackebrandtia soli]|uniref:D-inositol-3-phosphate glycosyltransferase n=1 Tax=Stackebrandtia soli TaxID=1892856 RepID=UPI0039E98A4E